VAVPSGGRCVQGGDGTWPTMRGRFIAREATGPPGAKAPTGRYLSLVIDAKTFRGLDFGISPKPPPVPPASLGPVTYLTGPGH
jgi:hypothetical protein